MFNDEFKNRYNKIPFAVYKYASIYKSASVILHQHKEIEIITLKQGKADFYIGDNHFTATKGDVIITLPYEVHRIEIPATQSTVYNCMCFDLSIINDKELVKGLENNTLSTPSLLASDKPYTSGIFNLLEKVFTCYDLNEVGFELEIIGYLSFVFATLKRNNLIQKTLKEKASDNFCKQVIEYITLRYKEQITSFTIANALFLSNSYFCRLFKKSFGCCFSSYLLTFRLEKAKSMLETTEKSIADIATDCGFNSLSYFGKNFKDVYGSSPIKYRKAKKLCKMNA